MNVYKIIKCAEEKSNFEYSRIMQNRRMTEDSDKYDIKPPSRIDGCIFPNFSKILPNFLLPKTLPERIENPVFENNENSDDCLFGNSTLRSEIRNNNHSSDNHRSDNHPSSDNYHSNNHSSNNRPSGNHPSDNQIPMDLDRIKKLDLDLSKSFYDLYEEYQENNAMARSRESRIFDSNIDIMPNIISFFEGHKVKYISEEINGFQSLKIETQDIFIIDRLGAFVDQSNGKISMARGNSGICRIFENSIDFIRLADLIIERLQDKEEKDILKIMSDVILKNENFSNKDIQNFRNNMNYDINPINPYGMESIILSRNKIVKNMIQVIEIDSKYDSFIEYAKDENANRRNS